MAPAATNPATVQLPSALTLQGLPLPVSSCGGGRRGEQQPRQPSWPFPGDDATPHCAPSGSGLCSEGGPSSPTPGEAAAQGYYLNFPTTAPPAPGAQSCTVLSSSCLVEEGPMISLTAGPCHRDLSSCALAREEPLCHWLPPSPQSADTEGLEQEGGIGSRSRCPPCSPPFLPPQAPGLRDHRKAAVGCVTTGLAWPQGPLVAWAGPGLICPGPEGTSLDRPGSTARGARWGQPSPPLAGQCAPRAVQPHRPMSCQCHCPTGRHPTRRMPPCASRAAVCGVAPSPPGAGLAHPPLPSTHSPGHSFADF